MAYLFYLLICIRSLDERKGWSDSGTLPGKVVQLPLSIQTLLPQGQRPGPGFASSSSGILHIRTSAQYYGSASAISFAHCYAFIVSQRCTDLLGKSVKVSMG